MRCLSRTSMTKDVEFRGHRVHTWLLISGSCLIRPFRHVCISLSIAAYNRYKHTTEVVWSQVVAYVVDNPIAGEAGPEDLGCSKSISLVSAHGMKPQLWPPRSIGFSCGRLHMPTPYLMPKVEVITRRCMCFFNFLRNAVTWIPDGAVLVPNCTLMAIYRPCWFTIDIEICSASVSWFLLLVGRAKCCILVNVPAIAVLIPSR